jgi:MoaA/NifB/PqqE/SkfB family radical SAM enzyme
MKHICYHPWVGLDISPQGEIKPCCKYQNYIDTSLSEYLTNKEVHQLKEEFLEGKRPAGCKRCWDDEDAGLPSKRQIDWKYIFHSQVPNLSPIKVLSLPFGNSCNLACRTCGSYASSGWIAESKKLQKYLPKTVIYKHQKFYQDKNFIDQIKSLCSDIMHVEFPGGEPFLAGVDEHLDFLDFLLEHNPQNISLHYMTNATIFPKQEFWNKWTKFKNVDIQLSIDGIDKQFEYTRWPAKWPEVNGNIQRFIEERKDNIQISISHTVSIFNVLYLPEFLKWCLKNKLGKPYLGLVSDPVIYSIKTLPPKVKELISNKLNRFIFTEIVSYMNSENLNNEFNTTIKHIKLIDQQRNEFFEKTFPELCQLLKDAECQI